MEKNVLLMELLAPIGLIAALVLAIVALSGSLWLMIWPVERRAQAKKGGFRFRLIDLGCLLVYWQVIMAGLVALGRDNNMRAAGGALVGIGVFYCLVSAMAWSVCVSVLSRAGIESSARRAAFILVSIPGAIAAAMTLLVSGGAVIGAIIHLFFETPTGGEYVPAVIFAAACAAIFLLRLLSLWIAADARAS